MQNPVYTDYDPWILSKKKNKCAGWMEYQEWINEIFRLAPPAPGCSIVENFTAAYNTSKNRLGALVLQRNAKHKKENNNVFVLSDPKAELSGRSGVFGKIWHEANSNRSLPPNLEMVLYPNDKPRVPGNNAGSYLGLPPFVITGDYPIGSGLPKHWMNYLPFPSHFVATIEPQRNAVRFESRRPVVFYRGSFSENCWSRFESSPFGWQASPRFKLANATRHPSDSDVLDIKLTGIAVYQNDENATAHIANTLLREYNITMGSYESAQGGSSRYMLAVSGNGWAGATLMRGLQSGGAVNLFVEDKTIDYEGYSREMGELYFAFLKKDEDVVMVDYDTIAATARKLNTDPVKAKEIGLNGVRFAKKYLGRECSLDLIELLAWKYYNYTKSGCPTAFSHVDW